MARRSDDTVPATTLQVSLKERLDAIRAEHDARLLDMAGRIEARLITLIEAKVDRMLATLEG